MQKTLAAMALLGIFSSANCAPVGNQGIYTDQDLIVVQVSLSPTKVLRDAPVTVSWHAYAQSPGCVITGVPGGEYYGAGEGSYTFNAQASTRITVTCTGELRPVSASRSLYVAPDGTRPEVTAYYSPNRVLAGGTASFNWYTFYADDCTGPNNTSGPSGAVPQYFGSAGTFGGGVTCSNRFGSTTASANITVVKNPPGVDIWAVPDYLSSPGRVWVRVAATNATYCDREANSYEDVDFTQSIWVTCSNDSGSTTRSTTVRVGPGFAPNQGSAADGQQNHNGKAVPKKALNLSHLGIDLQQEGIEFVVLDLNGDQEPDVMVLDRNRSQLQVLLAEKGRFNRVHDTFDKVPSFDVIETIYIEKNAAQNAHLQLKNKR